MKENLKDEQVEEFFKTGSKKNKREKENDNKKSLISRIVNIALWVILFAWMALVLVDYIHTRNDEKPQFCWWNKNTTQYEDGTVTSCNGLGYKVINYNRDSFKAIEFGPFWIKDRTQKDK